MKNTLLVIGTMPYYAPYVGIYLDFLRKNKLSFDLLCWNRFNENIETVPDDYLIYDRGADVHHSKWMKLFDIYGFSRYVKKAMQRHSYSTIIAFTIPESVFLQKYLEKYYKGRYVFDIRDYSPMMKLFFFRKKVEKLIFNSAFTSISSKGFLRWLPNKETYRYYVSHNTSKESIDKQEDINVLIKPSIIKILTIGQISYYDSQECFVNHLANCEGIALSFVGAGPASEPLRQYVSERNIENVSFSGRYVKKDEMSIVKPYHMINIWLKHSLNADSCMANRFYLSVIQRKPMIVRKGTFQAELVEKYYLGLALDDDDIFSDAIIRWWDEFDADRYNCGCRCFLKSVVEDLELYEKKLLDFATM